MERATRIFSERIRFRYPPCARSPQKVVGSNPGFAFRRLENFVNPAVNGYLFRNQGRIRHRKERDGHRFLSAVVEIQWASHPHCPYGLWLLETFTFFSLLSGLRWAVCVFVTLGLLPSIFDILSRTNMFFPGKEG